MGIKQKVESVYVKFEGTTLEYAVKTPDVRKQLKAFLERLNTESKWSVGLRVQGRVIALSSYDFKESNREAAYIQLTGGGQ